MLLCFRCIFHIMCAAVAIFAMNIVHVLQILIKLNRQITCVMFNHQQESNFLSSELLHLSHIYL